MSTIVTVKDILSQIDNKTTKLGDLRKMASTIKKDHQLALQLWQSGQFLARQLAILIMDKKLLSQDVIDILDKDMQEHPVAERLQLMEWLMANQLMKDKNTIVLIESWRKSSSVLQRRTYWYYQGRLRWVGQTPPNNTETLMAWVERDILNEEPEVQWAMNFTTAQIGIFQEEYRKRCIAIGLNTGLYKNEVVAKNCTPNYLPLYIDIQVAKQKKIN